MQEYENQVLVCPACNGSRLSKKGFHNTAKGSKQRYKCYDCGYRTVDPMMLDKEVIAENVRLEKRAQRFQDLNRIKNKSFREFARLENCVAAYSEHLVNIFQNHQLKNFKKIKVTKDAPVGLIQISDTHFNELVDLDNNKYNFEIASKRLRTFIRKAKIHLKACGVKKVFVAFTGDLMNSDRRMDELLSNATNRSNATFVSVEILRQVLIDLREDFMVICGCISGNESRIQKDIGWTNVTASDNYDFTIYNILELVFKKSDVEFIRNKDVNELVVELAGQNVLMLHGHSIRGKQETSITQIKGRYSSKKIFIDYVISGHLHSARIGDTYGRSSALVGANSYSEKGLNLEGRASQNVYLFYKNGNRDGIKIDLQNYDKEGYEITKELESYNAKSNIKGKGDRVILKVVSV